MKNNLLKRLAEKAKNRLLGKGDIPFDKRVCVKVVSNDESDFAMKAKEVFMQSEMENSFNPIKMLMDEKILIKLDERGRERYLLETIDRYLKAKSSFISQVWLKSSVVRSLAIFVCTTWIFAISKESFNIVCKNYFFLL